MLDLVDAYNAWCGYVVGFTAIEVKPPTITPDVSLQDTMRDEDKIGHPIQPIQSLRDGVSRYPETATSVAVRLYDDELLDTFARESEPKMARQRMEERSWLGRSAAAKFE
jgi:hypothetical protein